MSKNNEGGGGPSPAAATFRIIEDADGFREAAMFVFGNYGWLRQTANAFGKNESTIHRWVNEQDDIPFYARSAMAAWKIAFETTGMRPPEDPKMRMKQQAKLEIQKARKAGREGHRE